MLHSEAEKLAVSILEIEIGSHPPKSLSYSVDPKQKEQLPSASAFEVSMQKKGG